MQRSLRVYDKFDYSLSLLLMMLCIISCGAIYSAQTTGQYESNYFLLQIGWYVVGIVIIAIIMQFDSDQVKKVTWYLYGVGIFLLLVLAVSPNNNFTPIRNGAQSWYVIPGIGQIQPSEFMKVFLILALSKIIVQHHEKNETKTIKTDFILLLKMGLVTAVPFGLIMMQPDLGTGLVIIAIFSGIVLISDISWKILVPLYTVGSSMAGTILYFVIWKPELLEKYLHIKQYQFKRIYTWLDPEAYKGGEGFHLYQSIHAIGSGLITGKGFGGRSVYIPESHTDFIFSVIGEEFGFVGCSIVIGIFFLLIYHITKTALDTKDLFNTLICAGVISMITFHVFQNIGMTIQVLPITGIPLPFISYGGSSLMGNMMAMGLIFGIRYHHKVYMFDSKAA